MAKGVFGYRKSDVQQLLADRDTMLRQAEARIRASENRIAEMEKVVAEATDRKLRMEEQVRRLRQEIDTNTARATHGERMEEELRAESDRLGDEAERMASWKRSVQEVAEAMIPTIERFRVAIADLPDQINEALVSLDGRIASLTDLIDEFGRISGQVPSRIG